MTRALPFVLALLLLVTPPATALQADAPRTTAETIPPSETPQIGAKSPVKPAGFNNTSSHLSLGESARSSVHEPSVSLGASLAMDVDQLDAKHRAYTVDERLASVQSSDQEQQILLDYESSIESRILSVKSAERRARQQYSNGDISASQYARRLAILDGQADSIEMSIDHLNTKSRLTPRYNPHQWILKAKIHALRGPVRSDVQGILRGEEESKPIYTAATKTGLVLSSIRSTGYVREAYRADNRNASSENEINRREALNLTRDYYPWANEHRTGSVSMDLQYANAGVWITSISHPHGAVDTYLDSGTERIFLEEQYKVLTGDSSVPFGAPVRNTSTHHNLTVNRTYPGGPLRVNLTKANGEPVDGTVTVNGITVGNTGDDGLLFTIAPSQRFTVSATHERDTLNVSVRPYGAEQTNTTRPSQD